MYVVGLVPYWKLVASEVCRIEVVEGWYVQRVNPGGVLEREFWYTLQNVGNTDNCHGFLLLVSTDA